MDERLEQPGEQSGNEKMSQDEKKGKKNKFHCCRWYVKKYGIFLKEKNKTIS